MTDDVAAIHWAPRVVPWKVRQLYENDAQGLIDEGLIDDVAYGFYARCQSILTTYAAEQGTVTCPRCGAGIPRRQRDEQELLRCPLGHWQVTWDAYWRSYRHKQLGGGRAVTAFTDFVEGLPTAQTPRDKMLLIDRLVHACHHSLTGAAAHYKRPAACNVIQGKMNELIALLDGLAYGPCTPPEILQTRAAWHEEVVPYLFGAAAEQLRTQQSSVDAE
jgi:hypothetical protein